MSVSGYKSAVLYPSVHIKTSRSKRGTDGLALLLLKIAELLLTRANNKDSTCETLSRRKNRCGMSNR